MSRAAGPSDCLAGMLLVGLVLLAGACARTRAPSGVRAAPPPGEVTPAFQGMRTVLLDATSRRARGDLAGVRAVAPTLTAHGLGLLRATLPHDLRDADVERYLDGRAALGEALKRWAWALEGTDDARVGEALDTLSAAYWAWVDAYKGLPPERSV